MKTEPTIWWVNVYDHEAVPYREGIPQPKGYVEFVPKADYDALLARHEELLAQGRVTYGPDVGGDLEDFLEPGA